MSRTPNQILQSDYLLARAKIIEVAAILDRIDRASSTTPPESVPASETCSDPLFVNLQNAIRILTQDEGDKTRRIQSLLSRPYDTTWRAQFKLPRLPSS